jgi:UDP-glucose 4-epimerase
MKVLVTGGAGYVGSHTVIALIESGFEPVVIDNLENSSREVFKRIQKITGHAVAFHELDARETLGVRRIIRAEKIRSVIHFAALKSVEESIRMPIRYYANNLDSLFGPLEALEAEASGAGSRFIFSSSATVYGVNGKMPISEEAPTGLEISNPYGWSKYFGEQILRDEAQSNGNLSAVALRYFNPIGAHPSGLLGESPVGAPSNVAPLILQVAAGQRPHIDVFGNDYPTVDGTGVRDYVHVMDIAEGHVAALRSSLTGFNAINLGTGKGTSVIELIRTFESISGVSIPYEIKSRRAGDVAECFANVQMAERSLSWKALRSVADACGDMWNWVQKNPNGYEVCLPADS